MPKGQPELLDFLLAPCHFQHAEWPQHRHRLRVVVACLQRRFPACPPTTRERPDGDFGLPVDRDSQAGRVVPCSFAGGVDVVEDRVGLGNLFLGRALITGRNR